MSERELWEISLKNRWQYDVGRVRIFERFQPSSLGSGDPFELLIMKIEVTILQNKEEE